MHEDVHPRRSVVTHVGRRGQVTLDALLVDRIHVELKTAVAVGTVAMMVVAAAAAAASFAGSDFIERFGRRCAFLVGGVGGRAVRWRCWWPCGAVWRIFNSLGCMP